MVSLCGGGGGGAWQVLPNALKVLFVEKLLPPLELAEFDVRIACY